MEMREKKSEKLEGESRGEAGGFGGVFEGDSVIGDPLEDVVGEGVTGDGGGAEGGVSDVDGLIEGNALGTEEGEGEHGGLVVRFGDEVRVHDGGGLGRAWHE